VALLNGTSQHENELVKADQALILEAIKANNPDKAATNLNFLVETALIAEPKRREELRTYLKQRKPGEGPVLSPALSTAGSQVLDPRALFEQYAKSVGLLEIQTKGQDETSYRATCFIVSNDGYALAFGRPFRENDQQDIKLRVTMTGDFLGGVPATIIQTDKELGAALIKLNDANRHSPFDKIGSALQPLLGSRVNILSYDGLNPSPYVSQSVIGSLNGPGGAISLYGGIGLLGPEGSPVLNEHGEVIAVLLGAANGAPEATAKPIQFFKPLLAIAGVK